MNERAGIVSVVVDGQAREFTYQELEMQDVINMDNAAVLEAVAAGLRWRDIEVPVGFEMYVVDRQNLPNLIIRKQAILGNVLELTPETLETMIANGSLDWRGGLKLLCAYINELEKRVEVLEQNDSVVHQEAGIVSGTLIGAQIERIG